ncbi:helicase-associated domain-containing protein [Paenibacillus periandrae]|uniref:helicase-associated domain-containing protein n=1 Tax=Paenibacillus periandrae TaxID=1761741 RepID=UPI001F089561|nr:helicase-associated domain-containing protein [Paenibacillus periandrae]
MNHAYFLGRMEPGFIKKLETERIYAPWIQQGYQLVTIWNDIEIMKSIYGHLSERERRLLQLLVIHVGCVPFEWPKLERLTHSLMSGAEARVGLLLLVEKGFLYVLRKSWGEQLYVMAHDGLAMWQQILWPQGEGRYTAMNREPLKYTDIELTDQGRTGLVHNIFQSMVYISQNDMKLTRSGALPKRTLLKWKKVLFLDDDAFKACGIQYAYMNVYSESIAVVLDFMIRLQIVRYQDEELVLQVEESRRWLCLSEAEQNERLYLLWKELMFPTETWLQHAVLVLEHLPNEEWISGDHILSWLRDCEVIPATSLLHDEMLVEQLEVLWLNPLLAFGWLEKGISMSQEETYCYRWSQHPLAEAVKKEDTARYLYIQPDFEVLVPPDVGFAVRWELAAVADHLYTDSMSLYHITKKSLQRGIQTGRRVEYILAFLEQHAVDGIPEHVQFTIDQWSAELGFKAGVFDIDKDSTIVMDTSESDMPKVEACQQLAHRKGLLDSRHSFIQLEMERQLPSLSELYSELRTVPAAWMKEYRSYHSSTRREITLKAMEWKTELQIRGNGIDRVIIPRMLQEIDGNWGVSGYDALHGKEISLLISDCDEMRIIVPGIYEKY